MKGGVKSRSWLLCALCLCGTASIARADEADLAAAGTTKTATTPAPIDSEAMPIPGATFPGLEETRLGPADRMTQTPPNWNGDWSPRQRPSYIDERIQQHRLFVRPFVNPSVFPEISASVQSFGGWNPRSSSGEASQFGYVSFYAFEIYAPILTIRDSDAISPNRFRVNIRLPMILANNQAIALFATGQIPVRGKWTDNGSYSTYAGYAIGGKVFSAQLRLGFGVDQLIGEVVNESPIATSVLGDITAGVWLGKHAQIVAELDARRLVGRSGAVVRAWPGVKFYPLEQPTLSVGVSGFYWADNFITPQDVGKMRTRQAGASIDLGYLFY
jgi:hypothetical protein